MKPGNASLSVFTNEKGGIIDDTVMTKQDKGLYVVSNAGCADKDLAHIRKHLKQWQDKGADVDVQVYDTSLVALQGPKAAKVLEDLAGQKLKDFKFMTGRFMTIKGLEVYVTRCGYTGEDGFEVTLRSVW
jgi:aminomethyltransferase